MYEIYHKWRINQRDLIHFGQTLIRISRHIQPKLIVYNFYKNERIVKKFILLERNIKKHKNIK